MQIALVGWGVVLAKFEYICEVFAGFADVFYVGEGNAIFGLIMGEHLVLLLDEEMHFEICCWVMVVFYGEVMCSYVGVVE